MLSFRLVSTGNDYTAAATIESKAPGSGIAIVTVTAAGVIAQFKSAPGDVYTYAGVDWGDEVYMAPQTRRMVNVAGVRFRSAVAGVPAQVSAELYEAGVDAMPGEITAFAPALSVDPSTGPTLGNGLLAHADLVNPTVIAASGSATVPLAQGSITTPGWYGRARVCVVITGNGALRVTLYYSSLAGANYPLARWLNVTNELDEEVMLTRFGTPATATQIKLAMENLRNYSVSVAYTVVQLFDAPYQSIIAQGGGGGVVQ